MRSNRGKTFSSWLTTTIALACCRAPRRSKSITIAARSQSSADLDGDVGTGASQFLDYGPQDCFAGTVAGNEPEGAGRLLPQLRERRQRLLDAVEVRRDRAQQALACRRRAALSAPTLQIGGPIA